MKKSAIKSASKAKLSAFASSQGIKTVALEIHGLRFAVRQLLTAKMGLEEIQHFAEQIAEHHADKAAEKRQSR